MCVSGVSCDEPLCGLHDALLFVRANAGQAITARRVASEPHLYEDQELAPLCDEVNLAARCSEVSPNDPIARAADQARGELLGQPAERCRP